MMFDIQAMAFGIIGTAILIGIGLVVLATLGNVVGGTSNTTIQTMMGYLGTGSGGLVTWIPIIIVITIGFGVFSGFFGGGKKRR